MLQKTFLKSKNAYKVKFIVKPEQATSVEIFGLNKDWENPIPMVKKKDGTFSVEVALPNDTKHEFKYRIDRNDWFIEEDADGESPNGFGSTNSILVL